jgi:YD repeat-containing protein
LLLLVVVAAAFQKPGRPPRRMVEEYRFDNRGRLIELIRPGGHSVRYSYDGGDRLVRLGFSVRIPAKEIAHSDLMSIKIEASSRWTVIC